MPEKIIPPRVPFVDPRTGVISREWYHFLLSQANLTGGAALTKTNDSNVTLSLGGSPSSALLAPVSLTLGWTGQLPIARGGTGADTAAEALTNLGAAPVVHGHSMDDVTGLQDAIDAGDAATLAAANAYTDTAQAAAEVYSDGVAAAAEAAANAYTDAAVAGITGSTFSADDIVTVPDGDSFSLVFTEDGNVVALS